MSGKDNAPNSVDNPVEDLFDRAVRTMIGRKKKEIMESSAPEDLKQGQMREIDRAFEKFQAADEDDCHEAGSDLLDKL